MTPGVGRGGEQEMRLKWVFETLRRVEVKGAQLAGTPSDSTSTTVTNVRKFKAFVSRIELIPSFRGPVEQLKLTPLYASQEDSIRLRNDVWQEVQRLQNWVFSSVSVLLQNLRDAYTETTECTITLKLPDPRDLEDMIKMLEVVQMALAQNLHNEKIKGVVKIESWETGSFWIDVFVGSQAAVLLVGSMAWAAAVVYKKLQEGRMFAEYVQGLKVKNDSLEDLRKGQEQAIQLLIEREARNILVEHFDGEKDPEQFERLKMGIRTMAELIDRGAEIHPALNAPEQVQNLFPDTKHIENLQSRIKLLDSKTDGGEKDRPTTA